LSDGLQTQNVVVLKLTEYPVEASTKPQYTIDTDKTERKRQQENVSSEDDNTPMTTPPTKSKSKSCKKTRQQDIPSILEQQHSEFAHGKSITSFHFFFKALYLYMHCWYATLQLRVSKRFSDTCFHNTT
jgi:hypothetical protein